MSETTNLKLFKHDNPETNENEFDINTALNENWDKIDETVGENKKNIEQLKSENERLKEDLKGLPKGTFSGESIDLNDSAEMRLQELKIFGNSRQDGEPTPEIPVEIESCGDNINIFEATSQTFTANNNYIEYNENNNEYHILSNKTWFKKQMDNLKQGETYTLSFDAKSIIDNVSIDNFFRIDSNITGTVLKSFNNEFLKTEYKRYSLLFVPQGTTVFLNIRNSNGIEAYIKNIKIVKGTDDTYSPYGQGNINIKIENNNNTQFQIYTVPTQKTFKKVGEYKDTFVKKDKKWYERHLSGRRIFTGTEYWELRNSKSDTICFGMNERNINKYKAPVMSNWFVYGSGNDAYSTNKECIAISDYTQINIKKTCLPEENVVGFKQLLAEKYAKGKPLYADYVLIIPEEIECAEEQCRILDKIENEAKTYKNITHIYSTDNVSPILEGTYNKDIETMINNISTTIAESEE